MSFYHSSSRDPLITLLVDEELHSRQRLSRLLREIAPEFTGIAEASDVGEALKKIERFSPNLIFAACPPGQKLQKSILNGFPKNIPVIVVCKDPERARPLITEFGGFYLVKPVDAQHLRDLLDATRNGELAANGNGVVKVNGNGHANGTNGVVNEDTSAEEDEALGNGNGFGNHAYLNRLVVKHQGRFRLLPIERVIWFGTEFRLVYAHTEIRRYPIDLGLDQLESRLDPGDFARIHRSAIVNINRIKEIVPISGGRSKVLLREPQERTLPLSASRARAIKELIKNRLELH